jgi:hypothetical protein
MNGGGRGVAGVGAFGAGGKFGNGMPALKKRIFFVFFAKVL